MTIYNERTRCTKCGGMHISSRYDGSIDGIRRVCGRCGYRWVESPLDAPEEPSIASVFRHLKTSEG